MQQELITGPDRLGDMALRLELARLLFAHLLAEFGFAGRGLVFRSLSHDGTRPSAAPTRFPVLPVSNVGFFPARPD